MVADKAVRRVAENKEIEVEQRVKQPANKHLRITTASTLMPCSLEHLKYHLQTYLTSDTPYYIIQKAVLSKRLMKNICFSTRLHFFCYIVRMESIK